MASAMLKRDSRVRILTCIVTTAACGFGLLLISREGLLACEIEQQVRKPNVIRTRKCCHRRVQIGPA